MKKRVRFDLEELAHRLQQPGFSFRLEDFFSLKAGLAELLAFYNRTRHEIKKEIDDNRQGRLF